MSVRAQIQEKGCFSLSALISAGRCLCSISLNEHFLEEIAYRTI